MDNCLLAPDNVVVITLTVAFVILDWSTGVVKAAKTHRIKSAISFQGLLNIMAFVLAIILGVLLHIAQVYMDLGTHLPFLNLICGYIVFSEIISIVENLGEIEPKLQGRGFMKLFDFANGKDE